MSKPSGEKIGELLIRIKEAKGLPGGNDPYCVVRVGKEMKKTDCKVKTATPVWEEEFIIDLTRAQEKVTLTIMDKDLMSKDDELCGASFEIGAPGGVSEFDDWVELAPPSGDRGKKKAQQDSYGSVHIVWSYNVAGGPNLFFLDEEVEDYDAINPSSRECTEEVAKLVAVLYRFAAVFFKIYDNFLWAQPFACLGQLLILYTLYFYTSYGLDALFPGLVALFLYYSRAQQRTFGNSWTDKCFGVMDVDILTGGAGASTPFRRTMPEIKAMLQQRKKSGVGSLDDAKIRKITFIWAQTIRSTLLGYSPLIDGSSQDLTTGLYNFFLGLSLFTFLVGSFVDYWRFGFVIVVTYMFMVFPLYSKYPRVREKMSGKAVFGLFGGYLAQAKAVVYGQAAAKMPGPPKELSPIPEEKRSYDDWTEFYRNREQVREKYGVATPPGSPTGQAPGGRASPGTTTGPGGPGRPAPYKALQVTVLQTRGLDYFDPVFVKILAEGNKFRTKPSSNQEWKISYEFPYVQGRANVELYAPTADPKNPQLLARGAVAIQQGTFWVPLQSATNDGEVGQLAVQFMYQKHD